jgi:pimeloyl-ACP methyl ester carboxylesterase
MGMRMGQRWRTDGAPAAGPEAGDPRARDEIALPSTARAVAAGAAMVSAAGAAVVALSLVVAPQERLVWQPPRFGRPDAGPPPVGAGRVDYAAADGQRLFAWIVEPRTPPRGGELPGTVLAFHGNAELAAWSVPWARTLARRTGWRVMLPEYRGYAGLGGKISHPHSRLDAAAALAAARAAAGGGGPLVLYGHSLGSAVAAELAADMVDAGETPAALVLESPFTSVRAMARVGDSPAMMRLWRAVARVHFDTRARVAALDAPVWVAHGLVDLVVPAQMGIAVHAAARQPGELLLLTRAGHNDVVETGGERYWSWLARALGVTNAREASTDLPAGR